MVGGNTPRTSTEVSPFVPEVLAEVLPLGVRLPHLESYDGSIDPEEHVYYFVNMMQLHNFSDAILCKTFSTTLKGVARTWFNQLPGGTITSFQQLADAFRSHFMASRPAERDTSYLFTVKQRSNESLKDYLGRCYKAMLEIPGVEPKVVVAAAKQGILEDSPFLNSISKSKRVTMEEFREKAEKYIL